jgi:hypothetical protein
LAASLRGDRAADPTGFHVELMLLPYFRGYSRVVAVAMGMSSRSSG